MKEATILLHSYHMVRDKPALDSLPFAYRNALWVFTPVMENLHVKCHQEQ